jgi:hypothetical protein
LEIDQTRQLSLPVEGREKSADFVRLSWELETIPAIAEDA